MYSLRGFREHLHSLRGFREHLHSLRGFREHLHYLLRFREHLQHLLGRPTCHQNRPSSDTRGARSLLPCNAMVRVVISGITILWSLLTSIPDTVFLSARFETITWAIFSPTSLPKTITVGVDAVATPSGWRWATPVDALLGHAYLYKYLFHVEPRSMIFSWTSPHPDNSNEDRRRGLWLLRGATGATDHTRKRMLSRGGMARHLYTSFFFVTLELVSCRWPGHAERVVASEFTTDDSQFNCIRAAFLGLFFVKLESSGNRV